MRNAFSDIFLKEGVPLTENWSLWKCLASYFAVACERQTFLLAHRRWGMFRETSAVRRLHEKRLQIKYFSTHLNHHLQLWSGYDKSRRTGCAGFDPLLKTLFFHGYFVLFAYLFCFCLYFHIFSFPYWPLSHSPYFWPLACASRDSAICRFTVTPFITCTWITP